MRFLFGFISASMFIAIIFVAGCMYFDFPISTNDEKQHDPQTQQIQQKEIRKEIRKENSQPKQPTKQKHNGITPPNMKEKTANEFDESQERKSEIQALQENDKAQEWKKEYNEINEGTDENPYVTINGRKVDPKHVTGNENNK